MLSTLAWAELGGVKTAPSAEDHRAQPDVIICRADLHLLEPVGWTPANDGSTISFPFYVERIVTGSKRRPICDVVFLVGGGAYAAFGIAIRRMSGGSVLQESGHGHPEMKHHIQKLAEHWFSHSLHFLPYFLSPDVTLIPMHNLTINANPAVERNPLYTFVGRPRAWTQSARKAAMVLSASAFAGCLCSAVICLRSRERVDRLRRRASNAHDCLRDLFDDVLETGMRLARFLGIMA